jgi:hypothetical protein
MTMDGVSTGGRQGFKCSRQSRRLHGKKGDGCATAAAPLATGDLTCEYVLNTPAESVDASDHLVIIVEQIVHGQQVSQKRTKTKWQLVSQSMTMSK